MNQDNHKFNEIGLSTQSSLLNIRDTMENETDGKSFRVKEYIPRRSNTKLLKLSFLIFGVICIILITILIAVFETKTNLVSQKSIVSSYLTENPTISDVTHLTEKSTISNESQLTAKPIISNDSHLTEITISNNNTFWRYDSTNKTLELLYEAENAIIDFDVLLIKNTIFWIENNVNESKIISTSIDPSNGRDQKSNILFQREASDLSGIAVDYVSQNIYFLEKSIGALIVVNSRTKLHSIVLAELDQPQDIALHSSEGLMFILQDTNRIVKGHMDGTSLNTIINANGITSFAIDRKSRNIYWVNHFVDIKRSDYNGKNIETIIKDATNIKTLSIADDQLFWAWSTHYTTNATFWSCLIDNGTCEKHVVHTHESFRNPKILAFHSEVQVSHPCNSDETCQDICLVKSRKNSSCACRLGFELNLDLKSCRSPQNFFVYIQEGVLKGSTLGNKRCPSSPNIIWPILLPSKFHIVTSKLEYDQDKDFLYLAMEHEVYRVKLKAEGNPKVLITSTLTSILKFTFDWLTNILYCISQYKKRYFIEMVNVENYVKTYIREFEIGESNLQHNYPLQDIAVNPRSNYLFTCYANLGAHDELSNDIVTHKMDTEYVSHFHGQTSFYLAARIAVDYDENRIYVLYNRKDFRPLIQHSHPNGSDQISIKPNITMLVKEIQVHQQWLYLIGERDIWRINKLTGADAVKVLPVSSDNGKTIIALTVVGATVHRDDDKNNLCFTNNGGCDQFCFSSPGGGRECGCKRRMNLKDEFSCG